LPLETIRAALRWLRSEKVPGVVIGGVAVVLHGYPRFTRDLDVLVSINHSRLQAFVASSEKCGFTGRVPDVVGLAGSSRMVLLKHQATNFPLDVSLGTLEFEEIVIERASQIKINRINIPVATPEDLIILKAIADRPQDIADIDHLLKENPRVDRRYIRRVLMAFSEILERPDISEQVEMLLARHPTRRRE
jgi:hypothetical protein